MSSQSIQTNTGQQAHITTDLSKIFIWDNRYENDNELNNSGYAPLRLAAGTVMGRITASGAIVPTSATRTDGSQFPVGVLANDMVIDSGALVPASICVGGDVASEQLVFLYGDTLDTVVNGRRYRDLIRYVGIKLTTTTEMSDYDNI